MWLPSVLFAYAALGVLFGGRALRWNDWDRRTPRLALLAWQGSVISVTVAATIGLLTAGHRGWESLLIATLNADHLEVHAAYGLPEAPLAMLIATNIGILLILRLVWALAATMRSVRRQRQQHRGLLLMLSQPARPPRYGQRLSVVDSDQPMVYCLPGPRARIIATTAALQRLTQEQFAAVLAHERAHLRFRHHWLLTWGTAFRRAFGPLPLFANFGVAAARLVEMAADDAAGRQFGRAKTAAALIALSGPAPAFGLAAGGATIERIERLVDPPPPPRRGVVAVTSGLVAGLLAQPAVISLAPALSLIGSAP